MASRPPVLTNGDETFQRLRKAYLIALGLIALAVLAEQWLVGSFLEDQRNDAEIINVAGRQRMLSQRLVKQTVLNQRGAAPTYNEFADRHRWLKGQLSDSELAARLRELDPIVDSLGSVVTAPTDSLAEVFLAEMDAIVDDYSVAAARRVERLRNAEFYLAAATIGVLLLELLFIFRPITRFVARQFSALRQERAAQETAKLAAEKAVVAREASLRELHALNEAIDEAVLFATLRRDGSPLHLSTQLAKLVGYWTDGSRRSIVHNLHPEEVRREAYVANLEAARAGSWNGEWLIVDAHGRERWLDVTLIPSRRPGSDTELFLLATDITQQKADRAELARIAGERIEEEVRRGIQRSQQVTATQEKERLRIARELHDGIGQRLTALKFSLESLRLPPDDKNARKVERLRELAKEIILSVRVATFNLSPPELSDYGLVAGLEKLCRELSRLTGQRILFENNGFDTRFDPTYEVNVYRIIQEAINNAIKYAEANYILVTLSPGERLFGVTITDDGKGFEVGDDPEGSAAGGGLGLRNMAGRVEDLNGRLFVRSDPETGTKVTLNLPMPPTSYIGAPPGGK